MSGCLCSIVSVLYCVAACCIYQLRIVSCSNKRRIIIIIIKLQISTTTTTTTRECQTGRTKWDSHAGFAFKIFHRMHGRTAEQLQQCLDRENVPDYTVMDKTNLVMKDETKRTAGWQLQTYSVSPDNLQDTDRYNCWQRIWASRPGMSANCATERMQKTHPGYKGPADDWRTRSYVAPRHGTLDRSTESQISAVDGHSTYQLQSPGGAAIPTVYSRQSGLQRLCTSDLEWSVRWCCFGTDTFKFSAPTQTFPLSAVVPRHCYLTLHLTLQWSL